jgi:hypothetical protein
MTSTFWFAVFGIIINLLGTLLLIFSFPLTFKMKNGELNGYTGKDDPLSLFYERVIKEHDLSIIIALSLISIGIILQISGIWLDQNC